jgi:hypothetical protein
MCLKKNIKISEPGRSTTLVNIGEILVDLSGQFDSGIAQLLIKPPKEEHEISHKDVILKVKPSSPYCICLFSNAKSHEDALNQGILLVQECLDILSMTGKEDLATRDYIDEYYVWWKDGDKKVFSYVSTFTLSISVPSQTLIVKDKNGNIIPPKNVVPNYSLAFRYFRLAQISEDMFDSFRNMYLAFELFLSSIYPKSNEKEIDWLRNSLQSSDALLQFQNIVPQSTLSSIDYIIDTIYLNARLPLFHSKSGKMIFIPTNINDRLTISNALNLLTKVVILMADKWYSCRRLGGWANLKYFEEYYDKILIDSCFVYSDNPKFTVEDTIKSKSIKKGIRFKSSFRSTFLKENRPNIYGQLDLSCIKNLGSLSALFVINSEKVLLINYPETILDIKAFDLLEVVCFLRGNNASQPRSLYPR